MPDEVKYNGAAVLTDSGNRTGPDPCRGSVGRTRSSPLVVDGSRLLIIFQRTVHNRPSRCRRSQLGGSGCVRVRDEAIDLISASKLLPIGAKWA